MTWRQFSSGYHQYAPLAQDDSYTRTLNGLSRSGEVKFKKSKGMS